ncbi:hypothetical protein LX66_2144 [Chitinophaga japonensis]|uniref:Uncharacterized protein n=1 Tax=Chitinophaga japonensis TaxID=104662 RepID=A0A562T4Z1_CHIJA|nr:hypothetical protein LX66_2144 [Chitinophaga japonensis]
MLRLLKYEYLFLVFLLLGAIFCLRSFRQKWPKPYQLFAVLVIVALLTEVSAILWKWYLHKMFGWNYSKNNLWIYNVFITFRLGILLVIFYHILNAARVKKAILYIGPVLVVFGLLNYLAIQGPYRYNTYSLIFAHIPIIILCLFYFKQLLEETRIIVLHKEPLVWIILGTFVYHVASLPFLIMMGFLNIRQPGLSMLYLPINMTLNLLLCCSYLISFLCKPQPMQSI